jgi:hypothetical protein
MTIATYNLPLPQKTITRIPSIIDCIKNSILIL